MELTRPDGLVDVRRSGEGARCNLPLVRPEDIGGRRVPPSACWAPTGSSCDRRDTRIVSPGTRLDADAAANEPVSDLGDIPERKRWLLAPRQSRRFAVA